MEHEPEDLLQALPTLWEVLPRLLERDWPRVCQRLEVVAARLEADAARDPRAWLRTELEKAFAGHAEAQARWWQAVAAVVQMRKAEAPVTPVRVRGQPAGPSAINPTGLPVRTRGSKRSPTADTRRA